MRNTRQKDLILSIINTSYEHLSTQEIYLKCRLHIKDISLGTVYRNLNKLVEQGLIKRIKMPDNIDRYDHPKNHAHFICLKCNKIIDLEDSHFDVKEKIGKNKVLDYELNYRGICEKCQRED